jgi:hypothetical protein
MKIRTVLGLAALGGAYYLHRQRGGELTLDSVKDSLRALRETLGDSFHKAMTAAEREGSRIARNRDMRQGAYDADLIEPKSDVPIKGST